MMTSSVTNSAASVNEMTKQNRMNISSILLILWHTSLLLSDCSRSVSASEFYREQRLRNLLPTRTAFVPRDTAGHSPPFPSLLPYSEPTLYQDDSIVPSNLDDDDTAEYHHPFRVDTNDISIALRWTGEMNRRLQLASSMSTGPLLSRKYSQSASVSPRSVDTIRGGGEGERSWGQLLLPPPPPPLPRAVPCSNEQPYRIPEAATVVEDSSAPLTVFHAKQPRAPRASAKQLVGADRWGPDLPRYLEFLADTLGLDQTDASLEFSLALIYMDRASSVETPRNNPSLEGTPVVPPVPYCTPRTVHRLILTSLLLSLEAIHGTSLHHHYPGKLESLGIPLSQLEQMVDWMRSALGDLGFYVSPEQLVEWKRTWEAKFPSKPATSKKATGDTTATTPERAQRYHAAHEQSKEHVSAAVKQLEDDVEYKYNEYQSNSQQANERRGVGIRVHR